MGNKCCEKSRPKKLSPTYVAKLKEITKLSEEEIQEWYEGFSHDCPEGKLYREKFLEVYNRYYPHGEAKIFCDIIFETYASRSDDSIDFTAFLIAVSPGSQINLDDRLGVIFDLYHKRDVGTLDEKELTAVIIAMYDSVDALDRKGKNDPKKRAEDIMFKSRRNELDRQQFIHGCKEDPVITKLLGCNFQHS